MKSCVRRKLLWANFAREYRKAISSNFSWCYQNSKQLSRCDQTEKTRVSKVFFSKQSQRIGRDPLFAVSELYGNFNGAPEYIEKGETFNVYSILN